MKKITGKMKISEIIQKYPEVVNFLAIEWGFHCVSCFFAGYDTFEQGAKIHGIEGKDFKMMLKMCNELIKE